MTLAPVAPRCPRCRGSCVDRDLDGEPQCLQCGRCLAPPAETLRLAPRFDDGINRRITHEARVIARAAAAGKRDWS